MDGEGDAPGLRGDEDGFSIIGEQGTFGAVAGQFFQGLPEFWGLFGVTEVVAVDYGIDPGIEPCFFEFQGDGLGMGVGDQGDWTPKLFKFVEKRRDVGMDADQVGNFVFEPWDIHFQGAGPVVQVVPRQGSFTGFVDREDFAAGLFERDAFLFGIGLRDGLAEENIIEMEVQQGSVHVQEHGVDCVPRQWQDGACRSSHDR